ncbi:MAG TPA: hypothetical protein DIC61_02460, partial [Pseudomonas sp.]|nr:hypothetical protein [Pseudomonas sp.]
QRALRPIAYRFHQVALLALTGTLAVELIALERSANHRALPGTPDDGGASIANRPMVGTRSGRSALQPMPPVRRTRQCLP